MSLMQLLEKKMALIDIQYLPPLSFFAAIVPHKQIKLEAHENFVKQTYRNRAIFLSSQKTDQLTVPLVGANKKILIKDIKIDNSQMWSVKHWRTLKTCYGKSPFFEFFADELHALFLKRYNFLWDLNITFLTNCLDIIRLKVDLTETDSYEKSVIDNVIDYRSLISPKKPELVQDFYKPHIYYQNFGSTFEANLSIIDLIMNEGPNALKIIKESRA